MRAERIVAVDAISSAKASPLLCRRVALFRMWFVLQRVVGDVSFDCLAMVEVLGREPRNSLGSALSGSFVGLHHYALVGPERIGRLS